MDEKTRQLRDIFVSVAGEETVTERQDASRGSLVTDEHTDDRLADVIETMRDRFPFRTEWSTSDLVAVVRGFFAGRSDVAIADSIEGEPERETVARARIDLHLVTDRDRDAPFSLEALRDALADGTGAGDIAAEFGVDDVTVRRYQHVLEVERQRRAVNDQYREAFEGILADRDLVERLTQETKETGLEDATDGMETNVSF